jgi:signal peptidase I
VLIAGVAWAVVLIGTAVITALKGKWWTLLLGVALWPAWIVGAIRLAKPGSLWARRFYDEDKRVRAQAREEHPGTGRVVAVVAAVVGLVAVAALLGLFKTYRIPSSAMEPTLHCARPVLDCSESTSDRVAAVRLVLGMEPSRGDIVAFAMPAQAAALCGVSGGVFVKRVIGMPGDEVATRNGKVLVNGGELEEPYVAAENRDDRSTERTVVPPQSYFLMGDNRESSCDSREYGPVPRDALVAKVVFRYWPLSRIGTP